MWSIGKKKLRFAREELAEIGKGMATNGNGFEVELDSKNFKAYLSEIKVGVRVNKVAHP